MSVHLDFDNKEYLVKQEERNELSNYNDQDDPIMKPGLSRKVKRGAITGAAIGILAVLLGANDDDFKA